MTVELNHTIVWCRDKRKSARFLSDILGLPPPTVYGPFQVVQLSNGVSLDFHDSEDEIVEQHYAFLLSEQEFDSVFSRIRERGISYWADPARRHPERINHNDGGRGVYFRDPSGHYLEIITRPYGSGG